MKHFYLLLLFGFSIFLTPCLLSQSKQMPDLNTKEKGKKVYKIKVKQDKEEPSLKTAYRKGKLENGSIRLRVQGISIMEPVLLNVIAADKTQAINIQLVKEDWEDVVREEEGVTRLYKTMFHTAKEFGIVLTSETKDAEFYVGVFVGEEVKMPRNDFFYPVSQFKEGETPERKVEKIESSEEAPVVQETGTNSSNMIMYIIAFLLFAILIILILIFMRKKKKTTNSIILIFFFSSLSVVANAGVSSMSSSNWGTLGDALGIPEASNAASAVGTLIDFGTKAGESYKDAEDLSTLSDDDKGHVPNIDGRDMPPMPSSCYESSFGGGNNSSSGSSGNQNNHSNSSSDNTTPPKEDLESSPNSLKPSGGDVNEISSNDKGLSPDTKNNSSDSKNKGPSSKNDAKDPGGKDKVPQVFEDPKDPLPMEEETNTSENSTNNNSSNHSENSDNNNSNNESNNQDACKCLERAYEDFYKNYETLEQLRILYTTERKKTDAAIKFGDNASGVHGVSGLAWQKQKVEIMKVVKILEEAYDRKYKQLTNETYQILLEIDGCEREMGFNDWYRRSGFMYFQFIKLRYQRLD